MTLRFRNYLRLVGILALLLPLVGCDKAKTELKDAINRAWPPVSTFDRRAQALVASVNALPSEPTLYLSLDQPTLSQILDEVQAQVANARFSHPSVNLPVINNLKAKVESEAMSVVADIAIELTDPAVSLTGHIRGQMAVEPRDAVLQPTASFDAVEVQGIKWTKQPLDAGRAVPAINAILKSTLANINGVIKLKEISLAFPPMPSIDPKDIKASGLAVTGGKIDVPTPTIAGISVLAADDKLEVLAELRLPGNPASAVSSAKASVPATEADFRGSFDKFKVAFADTRERSFGNAGGGGSKAAVTRRFIARVLNTAINSKAVHLEYTLPPQSQPFNADIRPYTAPHINCDLQEDTRNCRPANACTLGHDERSCGHDIEIRNPFNGQVISSTHVNDPICEAAKLAQNQIYLRNLDLCNAAYTAAIPICEAAKASQNAIYAAQKAACEVDKARLQEIEKLAHIGHISGDVGATGSAVADIHNFGAGDSLESLAMDVALAGAADVLAHVKFDPDTAGRLACTFGWDKDLKTHVSVAQQSLRLSGTITSNDQGALVISLPGMTIPVQLDPPPVQAIFVAHPELVVNCAALASGVLVPALAFRALQQQDIPSEISGKYQVPLPAAQFTVPVQGFPVRLGPHTLVLEPKLLPKAAWFLRR